MKITMFLIIPLLLLTVVMSCKNTLEDTLYNKKIESVDETSENVPEEIPEEIPGDEIVEDGARWDRVYFGSARWTR